MKPTQIKILEILGASYFVIFGSVLAFLLYKYPIETIDFPTYSLAPALSDYGQYPPTALLFNTSVIVAGIVLFTYVWYFGRLMNFSGNAKRAWYAWLAATSGHIIVGLIPLPHEYVLWQRAAHFISAAMFLGLASMFQSLCLALSTTKNIWLTRATYIAITQFIASAVFVSNVWPEFFWSEWLYAAFMISNIFACTLAAKFNLTNKKNAQN